MKHPTAYNCAILQRSRLIRRRCTAAIKPEARRQIYWTMVWIDTLVSIGATSASSLEGFVVT